MSRRMRMSEDVCLNTTIQSAKNWLYCKHENLKTEGMDCYECDANSGIDRAGDRNL